MPTQDFIDQLKETGITFYSVSQNFGYSYIVFCLADGLNQLAIPIISNIDYENEFISNFKFEATDSNYLFEKSDYVVLDLSGQPFYGTLELKIPYEKLKVAFSMSDNSNFVYLDDIPLFCTHQNQYFSAPGWRIPCAFGLSQRMIDELSNISNKERNRCILNSFRPSMHQDLRSCLDFILTPHLQKYFEIDSMTTEEERWGELYFEKLKASLGCLAYGGFFQQNLLKNSFLRNHQDFYNSYKDYKFLRDVVILRWDSWRFWESLASGCLTFHVDFEKYGFNLPVIPENWKHYIGLNLEDIKNDVERLLDEPNKIHEIAQNGRKWAVSYYSPKAVAERFLDFLEDYREFTSTIL